MNRITDLVEDALRQDNYKLRINFLIAGLICEEANDTPEKQTANRGYLLEINRFINSYSGDADVRIFLSGAQKTIKKYLEVEE